MGEHGSWSDFLYYLPGWKGLQEAAQHYLGRTPGDKYHWEWLAFTSSHFTLTHVVWSIFVLLFITIGAFKFSSAIAKKNGVVPPSTLNMRNLFEIITDAVYGLAQQVMGDKAARKFLPLIGALALFIFFSNLCALIPGFGVPTTTLKTNVAMAVLVFFVTHIYGLKEHGAAYLKHFIGPIALLAPLMIIIELIGHLARPLSLSLRLMGNMAADHKVVFSFFTLVPLLVPVPFLILGLLVCVVQTMVFCLLSMTYISMAIAHDH